jgi:hypothetical protein
MAGMCAMTPLREMVIDHSGSEACFPEEGLHVSLRKIDAIHGVDLHSATGPLLSAEFAIRGVPKALAIAAIPNLSDVERFRSAMGEQAAQFITPQGFQRWHKSHARKPALCPCCEAAAEKRRATLEQNPLTRIFHHAIGSGMQLRSSIVSPAYGFTASLTPASLAFAEGILEVSGADGTTMIELDPGLCHSLTIVRETLDGERFSTLKLYDSTGTIHLKLAAPGWETEKLWRKICETAG